MPDTDASNQRVTNALLRSDIQHLTGVVEGGFAELKARDADHEMRIRDNEKAIVRHGERLDNTTKVFGLIQAGFAGVITWIKLGPGS